MLYSILEGRIKVLILPLLILLLFINVNSCASYASHNHIGTSSYAYSSSNNFYNNHLRNRIIHNVNNNNIICLSMKQKLIEEEEEQQPKSLLDIKEGRANNSYLKSIYNSITFYPRTTDFTNDILPVVDNATTNLLGAKILSYADLSPETDVTPAGVAFLATNVVYVIAGYMLAFNGNILLGVLTEIAGVVSFWYHWSQLKFGVDRAEVRLALFTDYLTAGSTIITGGWYAVTQVGLNYIPYDVLGICALSIVCLSLSWVWEYGVPYLIWHSLWHLFSAYAGYLVGIQSAPQ